MEPKLLERGDAAKLTYSFALYERGESANRVRVQTDNFDQPLDINEGTKLDLGSTAKLRTLVTYLEIVAVLHRQYASLEPAELAKIHIATEDPITRWALAYLAGTKDKRLAAMLEAAVERRYSADPGERFFTGGGLHTFENFDPNDNARVLTVRDGLQRSVNLVFVRLMRDIVRFYTFRVPGSSASLLADLADPQRQLYLSRFADREAREFLLRFYRKYQGRSPEEAEALLLQGVHATPRRLAAIFRTIAPEEGGDALARFIAKWLPSARLNDRALGQLYDELAPDRFNLADRGYIAGVHPLELWIVGFLRQQPGASFAQAVVASTDVRQAVYAWLFNTRHKNAQDQRIKELLEVEAFLAIHETWKRLGYPFDSLVPSNATAIGASADRPAALAELMGILLNEGVRLPSVRIDALHFAAETPYETRLARVPVAGEQVLPAEVAQAARRLLAEVVEEGTARRLKGVFKAADGAALAVGGKTGTADHRFDTYGKGGVLLSSRVVSRTGTFVFYIGDRYFGTLTAYVHGPDAASYRFTSALPVQILKVLAPTLTRLLAESVPDGGCSYARAKPACAD
jgi:membrane peptidoglycan carboxypeptidase